MELLCIPRMATQKKFFFVWPTNAFINSKMHTGLTCAPSICPSRLRFTPSQPRKSLHRRRRPSKQLPLWDHSQFPPELPNRRSVPSAVNGTASRSPELAPTQSSPEMKRKMPRSRIFALGASRLSSTARKICLLPFSPFFTFPFSRRCASICAKSIRANSTTDVATLVALSCRDFSRNALFLIFAGKSPNRIFRSGFVCGPGQTHSSG